MATEYQALPGGDGQWVQPAPSPVPGFRIISITKTIALTGAFTGAEVTVRRNVPMETILDLDALRADGDLGQLIDIIPEIVVRWNIQDEDGTPIPVTPEGIRRLPVDLFGAVMDAFRNAVSEETAVSPN